MNDFTRPIPSDNEIFLDKTKIILSKTDAKGIIEYANDYFMEICGYDEWELMGEQHNVIRHPDMPKIVFKLLWERLQKGKNIHVLVKNLTKDGSFYWVVTSFETIYDEGGKIIAHFSYRKKPPRYAIETIIPIYKKLIELEEEGGMENSKTFLFQYLEANYHTYDSFILEILNISQEKLDMYFRE